jgi:2C-methyl-D-erythritol 2,4-cyclodiphosphate synthase
VLALAHVAVLAALFAAHAVTAAVAAALVIGAVGSHLPRSLRTWSLRDRRTVD